MYKADVVVVGAGAVGCAIARELSRYNLKVIVADKRADVGGDASKSNTAIIVTPYQCQPNTLESQLCSSQRAIVEQVVRDLDVPFKVCGGLMLALTEAQFDTLPRILDEAFANHVYDVEYLSAEEILEMEPEVNPALLGGLYSPREAIIDLFMFVVAMAENAAENGVEFLLNCEVTGINCSEGKVREVETSAGVIETRYVINAAGLFCDEIAAMIGECDFTVKPRKGQFFVLDKNTVCRVSRLIATVPTKESRGMAIAPTIHGNILAGSTAEDFEDKEDHDTAADVLVEVEKQCRQLVPGIRISDTITQFCGVRPNRIPEGFHFNLSKKTQGYLGISGVRSSGMSTCLAIAKYICKMLSDAGLGLDRKQGYIRTRRGIRKFSDATSDKREELLRSDAGYGKIICRCENVTEAEIVQAIHRHVGARSIDAVKRRVRAGMGRCQGGFCGPRIIEILERELKKPVGSINKDLNGSNMVVGKLRKS